jgi:toxin-antitoxin system PIN domain toxin
VILAFVRITTRSGILGKPLSLEEAFGYVDSWLAQPFVETLTPGEKHWPIFRNLIFAVGTAGNLTSDAHLAALAIEHGCKVYSADNDFKRFPGIVHVNPLAG